MLSSSPVRIASPMAWDPKSPSSLLLPFIKKLKNEKRMEIHSFASQDGIGANMIELSTLLKILETEKSNYRQVLHKCIEEWDQQSDSTDDGTSLEMLKLIYAITHLTETLILNPNPTMADAVPFLRLHYLPNVDNDAIAKFESAAHPEEYEEYWSVLELLVRRGCTSDAWALLCHHSICRRAFLSPDSSNTVNEYHEEQRQVDRDGFFTLRAILESAPLPGGRTDYHDAGVLDDADADAEDITPLLDGVHRLDYELWRTNTNMAMTSYRTWKAAIDSATSNVALMALQRREPRLISIIEMLSGNFSNMMSTWPEALCAEILYLRPNLSTTNELSTRLNRFLRIHNADNEGFSQTLLAILEGNHGRIISVLYELGGGSGAALPATITSLLCNLLMKSKLLPPSSEELQTDLLLAAADAIISSTTSNGIGMRLTTLLLLPHCTPKRDIRITATLAEALERFCPRTDAEAKDLLDLVQPIVQKKSRRVLDGCISIIISRVRYYEQHQQIAGSNNIKTAMTWLVRGMELEDAFYSNDTEQQQKVNDATANHIFYSDNTIDSAVGCFGSCVGLVIRKCIQVSHDLLELLLGKSKSCDPAVASQIVLVLKDEYEDTIDSVRVLSSLNNIVNAIISQDPKSEITRALEITKLLMKNQHGCCPLAPIMQWGLLLLALPILNNEQKCFDTGSATDFQSAFTTQGIHVMMERVLHISTLHEDEKKLEKLDELREALTKGLMRAIITENALRKQDILKQSRTYSDKKNLTSTEINSYSPTEREELVQKMLDL